MDRRALSSLRYVSKVLFILCCDDCVEKRPGLLCNDKCHPPKAIGSRFKSGIIISKKIKI